MMSGQTHAQREEAASGMQHEAGRTADSPAALRSGRRSFRSFFFWLFLLPAVLYFATIPLLRLPSYERWSPSRWGPALEFAYQTRGLNADVVIFGDSSAFLGVDPMRLERQFGIRAVVLPNTIGSLPVMGDKALDLYLDQNKKPRLIVLYFTVWNLDYQAVPEKKMFEGEEMLLRHDSLGEILRFSLRHPFELPAYPLRNYTTISGRYLRTLLHGSDFGARTAHALGHVDDTDSDPRLEPTCTLPAQFLERSSAATVEAEARKYRARGYQVVVYLAPVPGCRNANILAGRNGGGLAIAPPVVLPANSFLGDAMYAHVEPDAVASSTDLFGAALEQVLGR